MELIKLLVAIAGVALFIAVVGVYLVQLGWLPCPW